MTFLGDVHIDWDSMALVEPNIYSNECEAEIFNLEASYGHDQTPKEEEVEEVIEEFAEDGTYVYEHPQFTMIHYTEDDRVVLFGRVPLSIFTEKGKSMLKANGFDVTVEYVELDAETTV